MGASEVQQNGAEGLGVLPNSPKNVARGLRGVLVETVTFGIPVSAGMTKGACRGAKPLCILSIPQEWGIKGVDRKVMRRPQLSSLVLRMR
jgi:hypothetical protein